MLTKNLRMQCAIKFKYLFYEPSIMFGKKYLGINRATFLINKNKQLSNYKRFIKTYIFCQFYTPLIHPNMLCTKVAALRLHTE